MVIELCSTHGVTAEVYPDGTLWASGQEDTRFLVELLSLIHSTCSTAAESSTE